MPEPDFHTKYTEYLGVVREVLDAIANDQIDESNYELILIGEIPGAKPGDPLRQVTVVYDKRDQTCKGFFFG